ncbi:AraC family transcriptional regulator [Rasiella rasia]|uniref:AraC family transcriptional regulator n=1 Tax=Rasiella rasia TaxID=2744027 RepID=A0A6G6GI33_9FLAO|nr:helix-turn-helix domain-containing protein [Rasiella rasia]QIE58235.1 AraC family transcriptional regulator [Rasiella rasia]
MFSRKQKLDYDEIWSLSVFVGIFLIWLAYFTSEYTSYILGAFAFSFVLYLSILLLYFQRKKKFTISEKKEKYASSNIEEDEAEALVTKLTNVVTENQLYKNPNLTMPALAKKLHIRPQLLSQLLNDNLNKSFSNFINEYRIEEAKRMLSEDASLKIEVIAEQCGFNSNSAFYNAFKKVTNTTPAKYQNTKR